MSVSLLHRARSTIPTPKTTVHAVNAGLCHQTGPSDEHSPLNIIYSLRAPNDFLIRAIGLGTHSVDIVNDDDGSVAVVGLLSWVIGAPNHYYFTGQVFIYHLEGSWKRLQNPGAPWDDNTTMPGSVYIFWGLNQTR